MISAGYSCTRHCSIHIHHWGKLLLMLLEGLILFFLQLWNRFRLGVNRTIWLSLRDRCPPFKSVCHEEVWTWQGCPLYGGLCHTDVYTWQKCPPCRRCLPHRGVHLAEVSVKQTNIVGVFFKEMCVPDRDVLLPALSIILSCTPDRSVHL